MSGLGVLEGEAELFAVGHAEAGAGVPAGAGGVIAVVAGGDVAESGGAAPGCGRGVQGGWDQAEGATGRLGEPGDEGRPEW